MDPFDFSALDALAEKAPADEQPSMAQLLAHLELFADAVALKRPRGGPSSCVSSAGASRLPVHNPKEEK